MEEVHPKKTIVKQKFLKPKGPGNRRPKSPSRPGNGNGNAGNGNENAGNGNANAGNGD